MKNAGYLNFTNLPLLCPFPAKQLGVGTVDIAPQRNAPNVMQPKATATLAFMPVFSSA